MGHIFLEHTSIFGDNEQFCNSSREREANEFAGELLIPSSDLKLFLTKDRTLKEVLDRYYVSREAALIAILNSRLLKKISSSGFLELETS